MSISYKGKHYDLQENLTPLCRCEACAFAGEECYQIEGAQMCVDGVNASWVEVEV